MSDRVTAQMKQTWDALAERNAMHFISTARDEWDLDEFLQSGRVLVREILETFHAQPRERAGVAMDLGCGIGRLSFALSDFFERVIGVDVSGEMIRRANELKEQLGYDRVEFHCNNGRDLHFLADGICDLSLSYIVLQHIPDKSVALRNIEELARVTRPGGHVLFQVPVYRASLVVYPWRAVQRVFRILLWRLESWKLTPPERGVAFRGTRLTMSDLSQVVQRSHLELIALQRGPTTYRLCDNVVVYCQKLL
jgi:SAM-dependent methyltransferase